MEAGKIKPVIDRSYLLNETKEALRYYGEGRSRGKVVITVESEQKSNNTKKNEWIRRFFTE